MLERMMENILEELRKELVKNADEKTLSTSQGFFKETIKSYGVKVPTVHKLSREWFNFIGHESKTKIFDRCEQLWKSGYLEESFVACNWSYYLHKKYEPADFNVFERWIAEYVNNWASCDTLCNHTVGEFIEMYPEYLAKLKEFAVSENRWVRRAAAVTLIVPARKGKFLPEILEIAAILLTDKDDLVQKGYGWMLKAASQANQQAIFDFVMERKAVMPRTALRYAIEKMPEELRHRAMD
jgi:3-methyladenine DNA glycosylase AlkD